MLKLIIDLFNSNDLNKSIRSQVRSALTNGYKRVALSKDLEIFEIFNLWNGANPLAQDSFVKSVLLGHTQIVGVILDFQSLPLSLIEWALNIESKRNDPDLKALLEEYRDLNFEASSNELE